MKVVSINDSLYVGMWSHPEGRYIKSFAFQYNLKISPDRTKLCAASLSCGHLELFNISGDSLIKYLDISITVFILIFLSGC